MAAGFKDIQVPVVKEDSGYETIFEKVKMVCNNEYCNSLECVCDPCTCREGTQECLCECCVSEDLKSE